MSKLEDLIAAKVVTGKKFFRYGIRKGIREIAEEYAASEVDRLLDCLMQQCGDGERLHFQPPSASVELTPRKGEFVWRVLGDKWGDDKASLLKCVGFSE